MNTPAIAQLYQSILNAGMPGVERFYDALRMRGVEPMPDPQRGERNLYAPNPVVVDGTLVEAMVADANTFCSALRASVPDGATLLERAPTVVRDHFASAEVAERLIADLRDAHPLTSMDAFLVETPTGLERAYIEWQTVGSYLTLGRWVMACIAEAWPETAAHSTLTAAPSLTLATLGERLRSIYLDGIEDDPRQGVVLDYQPHTQPTRREFYAIQELTGGVERGMGIVDPGEITIRGSRPHYRRNDRWIPIRRVYSRLVYSDMQHIWTEADAEHRRQLNALFGNGTDVSWINHPLHFFYGSKADFPAFWAADLSAALPECRRITTDLIASFQAEHGEDAQLTGFVQKPVELQGGRAVELHPYVRDLQPDWILQREIVPADCHPTLWGSRTPEVRVMCLPDTTGKLIGGVIFTRVKAPDVFLSNAGHTARLNIPGTGEGYGVVVF